MEWQNGRWNGRMAELLTGMVEWRMEWRNGGMADGMAEWQMEWQNGGMTDGMVEWSNGGNGRMARMAGMVGMAEWQKEWQSDKMAEVVTYVLFMVHADKNGRMACGMVEWLIGGNGRMAGMAGMAGMAERQKEWQNGSGYIRTIYGTRRHRRRHRQRRHLNLL